MRQGVLILAHGSRRPEANQEIISIIEHIKARDPQGTYKAAFLNNGSPDMAAGIEQLAIGGAERIFVMPLFLVTGDHIIQDIPAEIQRQRKRWPGVEFVVTQHLAGHLGLGDIILERVQECSIS